MLATIAPLAADSSDEDGLGSLIDSVSSSWITVARTWVGTCDSSESAGSEAAIVTVAEQPTSVDLLPLLPPPPLLLLLLLVVVVVVVFVFAPLLKARRMVKAAEADKAAAVAAAESDKEAAREAEQARDAAMARAEIAEIAAARGAAADATAARDARPASMESEAARRLHRRHLRLRLAQEAQLPAFEDVETEICAICSAECPASEIAVHFEHCFTDMLPVESQNVPTAARQPSALEPAYPLFGLELPQLPGLAADTIISSLGPADIGCLKSATRGWHAYSTRKRVLMWYNAHVARLRAKCTACACHSFLADLRWEASELEGGVAAAGLARAEGKREVSIRLRVLSGKTRQIRIVSKAAGNSVLEDVTVGDLHLLLQESEGSPLGKLSLVVEPSHRRMGHFTTPLIAFVRTADIDVHVTLSNSGDRECARRSCDEWKVQVLPSRSSRRHTASLTEGPPYYCSHTVESDLFIITAGH